MTKEWKKELDIRAELAHQGAMIADLEDIVVRATRGHISASVEAFIRLLLDTTRRDIAECEASAGRSGAGAEWEAGYIEALEFVERRLIDAMGKFGEKR